MEEREKWNQGKKSTARPQREWNDSISDLNSMRLTKEELAKKLSSRQSHNLAIAKAELIERSRQPGSPRSFSPALTAKLRASESKTLEEVLADGTAAIALAHKVRNEELANHRSKTGSYFINQSNSHETESQRRLMSDDAEGKPKDKSELNVGHEHLRLMMKQQESTSQGMMKLQSSEENDADTEDVKGEEMGVVRRHVLDSTKKDQLDPYPLSPQGWQNLNNTIQLVVKTCEALWQQLEEERMTRQRLHFQLQEQRSVITTLTAELLQIQEHQEMILKELHSARSSNLTYHQSRPFPDHFQQQQQQQQQQQLHQHQQQQQQHQQARFQTPFKGLPMSRLLGERLPPRAFAYSDSSIDARQPRKKAAEMEELDYASRLQAAASSPYRLSHQGKSKSVTQLNRVDLEESLQDSMRYNRPTGLEFLNDASVIELLRNYRIADG